MLFKGSLCAIAASAAAALCGVAQAAPTVVYDSLGPAVYNLPSLGYQATSTSEFGDRVGFTSGTARSLSAVTVRMSNWALYSEYVSDPLYAVNLAGYNKALTFNIYGTGSGGAHGAQIATLTTTFLVPWRPEASAGCGSAYRAADGNCYNGRAFDVTFDFSSLGIVLPDEIVFGLAFDTQSYGNSPTGVNGPDNSLNFGLSGAATVGTDVDSSAVFWNTSYQGFLGSGSAGTFGEDRNPNDPWTGYVPAVQFVTNDVGVTAVPLPGTLPLALLSLAALAVTQRRRFGRSAG